MQAEGASAASVVQMKISAVEAEIVEVKAEIVDVEEELRNLRPNESKQKDYLQGKETQLREKENNLLKILAELQRQINAGGARHVL